MSKINTLKAHVPEVISQIKEFSEVFTSQGMELDNIYSAVVEVLNQCFVSSATWGLKFWEQILDIPVDESKQESHRREVITSKLRGSGTVTVRLIENVAESYVNGQVEVIENPEVYSFTVKFVGAKGIPPNLDDLKAAIERIKPAHLKAEYEFIYTTWSEVRTLTWNEIKTGSWDDLKTRKVI